MFTALFLLGVDDVGVMIEEPFSILALEGICGSVAANCNRMYENYAAVKEGSLVKSRQSSIPPMEVVLADDDEWM